MSNRIGIREGKWKVLRAMYDEKEGEDKDKRTAARVPEGQERRGWSEWKKWWKVKVGIVIDVLIRTPALAKLRAWPVGLTVNLSTTINCCACNFVSLHSLRRTTIKYLAGRLDYILLGLKRLNSSSSLQLSPLPFSVSSFIFTIYDTTNTSPWTN